MPYDGYKDKLTSADELASSAVPVLESLPAQATPEERDVILWSGLGLPAWVIAERLNLTTRQVYLRRQAHADDIAAIAAVSQAVLGRLLRHQVATMAYIGAEAQRAYLRGLAHKPPTAADLERLAGAAAKLDGICARLEATAAGREDRQEATRARVSLDDLERVLSQPVAAHEDTQAEHTP